MLSKSLQVGGSVCTQSALSQTELTMEQFHELEQSWKKFNQSRILFYDKFNLLFRQSVHVEVQATGLGEEGSHSDTEDSSSDSEGSTSGSSEGSTESDSQSSDTDDSSAKGHRHNWKGF